jgi:hypothetical protein
MVMWVPSSTPALNGVGAAVGAAVGAGGTAVGVGGTAVGAGGIAVGAGGTAVGAGGTAVGAGGTAVGMAVGAAVGMAVGAAVELHPTTTAMATAAKVDSLNGFLIPCSSQRRDNIAAGDRCRPTVR